MKALIGIATYPEAEQNGMNEALRLTWLGDAPHWCSVKFFTPTPEIDDYDHYFDNFKKACQYAAKGPWDYLFWCDRDTYVRPERFMDSRFDHYDYLGYPLKVTQWWEGWYASFGAGCWLSRKAFEILATAQQPLYHSDASAGKILSEHGITLWHDPRYFIFRVPFGKTFISMHLSQGTFNYDPAWMYEVHEEWKRSVAPEGNPPASTLTPMPEGAKP